MACFRYIIVNTMHKGDNKDNNNNDNTGINPNSQLNILFSTTSNGSLQLGSDILWTQKSQEHLKLPKKIYNNLKKK